MVLLLAVFLVSLISFNSFVKCEPEKGLIKHVLQTSFQQCATECDKITECITAVHARLAGLCYLYRQKHDSYGLSGVTFYSKPFNNVSNAENECANGKNCARDSCGDPSKIPATEILGNMVSVGAKLKYLCLDDSKSSVSVCLENGTWSQTNLKCNCSEPVLLDSNVVQKVKSWNYKKEDSQTLSVIAICSDVCDIMQSNKALCNIATGKWTLPLTICCLDTANGRNN